MKRILFAILPLLLAANATTDTVVRPKKDGGAVVIQGVTSGGVATDAVTVTTGGVSLLNGIATKDGTLASPAYSYTSDPNTGIYNKAADSQGFVAGGVEVGSINASGAWTVGASGGTQTHSINGSLSVSDTATSSNFITTSGFGSGFGAAWSLFSLPNYSVFFCMGFNKSTGDLHSVYFYRAGSNAAMQSIINGSGGFAFSVSGVDARATVTTGHQYQWSCTRLGT